MNREEASGQFFVTKVFALLATSFLVLAALLWLVSRELGPSVDPLSPTSQNAESQQEASAPESAPNPEVTGRSSVEPPNPEGGAATSSEQLTIHGVCVDEIGSALSIARVEAIFYEASGDRAFSTIAQSDGSFSFRCPSDLIGVQFLARITAEGYTTRTRTTAFLPTNGALDLGTTTLFIGSRVQGIVMDSNGAPIKGAQIQFTAQASAASDAFSYDYVNQFGVRSSDQGAFKGSGPARNGRWSVSVSGAGIQSWTPMEVDLYQDQHVEIRCVVRDSISGAVSPYSNDTGRPAYVRALSPGTRESAGLPALIHADGTFELIPNGTGGDSVELILETGGAYSASPVVANWGDRGVVIDATHNPSLVLRALDGRTGSALADFGVSLQEDPEQFRFLEVTPDEDGLVHLSWSGTDGRWLYVVPKSELPAKGPIFVRANDSLVEVVVDEAESLTVRVVGGGGQAISGARVSILSVPADSAFHSDDPIVKANAETLTFGNQVSAIDWIAGTTGPEGECTLQMPDVTGMRFLLKVTTSDQGELITALMPVGGVQEVVMPAFGRVVCTLKGAWPSDARVFARRSGDALVRRIPSHGFFRTSKGQAGDEWSVEHNGAPPGTWEFVVRIGSQECAATTADVIAAQPLELTIDSEEFLVAGGEVQVLDSVLQAFNGELHLRRVDNAGESLSDDARGQVLEVISGVCQFPTLLKGRYALSLDGVEWPLEVELLGSTPSQVQFP